MCNGGGIVKATISQVIFLELKRFVMSSLVFCGS